ncbi:hypothetical protein F4805DRAFT_458823 [Annulohypoxylon moriforme]|nr:hypothetical protein F4805DRAFT_458823 [Annulohypoxylon moriforme]
MNEKSLSRINVPHEDGFPDIKQKDLLGAKDSVQRFYESDAYSGSKIVWNSFASPAIAHPQKFRNLGAVLHVYNKLNTNLSATQKYYVSHIKVRCPLIRANLETTFAKFGLTYDESKTAHSEWPHEALFFSRGKIAQVAQNSPDEQTRLHCSILGTEIDNTLHDILEELKYLQKNKEITYELLWTLFPPGSIFVGDVGGSFGGLRVKEYVYSDEGSTMLTEHISFDGFRYGMEVFRDTIEEFPGRVSVNRIPGLTYYDHNSDKKLRDYLLERGEKILNFQGIHYVLYKPGASSVPRGRNEPKVISGCKTRDLKPERIMIDSYSYWRYKGDPNLEALDWEVEVGSSDLEYDAGMQFKTLARGEKARRPTVAEQERNRQEVLQKEENHLLLDPKLYGFSLATGTWTKFDVDDIHPIDFDPNIFDHVVHNGRLKALLQTLVECHGENDYKYDELVEGKGSSLLVLLTGEPGTGKSLMAESIADHLQRPLIRFTPIGRSPNTVLIRNTGPDIELAGLSYEIRMATDWEAVILFDNVNFDDDAFLYGIVVMTSNSTPSNPAVLSRAQIHIKFDSLTPDMRKQIWTIFNRRLPADVEQLSESDLEKLSVWKMDGRQIKNAMNMTMSWCRQKKERFNLETVEDIINLTCPSATKENTSTGSHDLLDWDVEDEQK